MGYIWYVGYGSNLSEQRFLCYIKGGVPRFGNKQNTGCKDKTFPVENKSIILQYPLYFALPGSIKKTCNWGPGGVAFIGLHKDKKSTTFCRMWKITEKQYEEVRKQEGRCWYCKEILIGKDDAVPIYTITNKYYLSNILCPSQSYIKTLALGLKETYNFNEEEITSYLITKDGIRGGLQKDQILKIIASICEK
ncbi:MAG: hypothetical protein FVQ85_19290 [Planctomycetes bacterium]|nr:hypothetical protein [Planctomycetota bacterium]